MMADCGSDDGGDDGSSWVIAVILCIISAFVINFGVNLQKLAWNRVVKILKEVEMPPDDLRNGCSSMPVATSEEDNFDHEGRYDTRDNGSCEFIGQNSRANGVAPTADTTQMADDDEDNFEKKSPTEKSHFRMLWFVGFLFIVFGSLFDFAALGFGAQSIVAPLGSTSLCANLIFAKFMLGEKLDRRSFVATAIIFLGCFFSVAFASHKHKCYTLDELFALYGTIRFAVYASCVFLAVFLASMGVRHIEKMASTHGLNSEKYTKYYRFHRFSYTFLSGLIGAQSILFAKTLGELIGTSFRGISTIFLLHLGSYIVLICMLTCIALQIYWLNCALARWDALYVVPVFQAQWIVFNVLGGGIFYGEFKDFTPQQAIGFVFGIGVTVFGVIILSQRKSSEKDYTIVRDEAADFFNRLDIASDTRSEASWSVRTTSIGHVPLPIPFHIRRNSAGHQCAYQESPIRQAFSERHDIEVGNLQKAAIIHTDTISDTLKTPLWSDKNGGSKAFYTSSVTGMPKDDATMIREYDITFKERRLGLVLELLKVKFSTTPMWCVRANINGPDHPVKPGHAIVSISGTSIVRSMDKADRKKMLESLLSGPRPITIRFRALSSGHELTDGSSLSTIQTNRNDMNMISGDSRNGSINSIEESSSIVGSSSQSREGDSVNGDGDIDRDGRLDPRALFPSD